MENVKDVSNRVPVRFGSVYSACLSGRDSVQCGTRPVLIVQNNVGNRFSPTVTIIPITSKSKAKLPTHVSVDPNTKNGLTEQSTLLCEQLQTISKGQLGEFLGSLSSCDLERVAKAVSIQMPFGKVGAI